MVGLNKITSTAKPLYIINFEEIAYHQHGVLYLIKLQAKYTLSRDEIQPEGLMIYTALRAVMICQACGLDKKIDKLKLVDFLVRKTGLARLRAELWSALTATGSHSLPTLQVPPSIKKIYGIRKNANAVYLVRKTGLDPYGKTTRPSNVRVCQFRHFRIKQPFHYTKLFFVCQYFFCFFYIFFCRYCINLRIVLQFYKHLLLLFLKGLKLCHPLHHQKSS